MPASKKVPRSDGETKTKNVTGPTRKLSRREERTKEIREALFKAAFQTVGEFGYAGSTVQLITRRARVANGTFYNYFSSQNELFERLLPELGERLRDFVDKQIRDAADAADVERIMLRGLFEFSDLNPEFYRILTEAEALVPDAHRRYIVEMTDWYRRVFSEQLGLQGSLADREYEVIAVILLAVHHYLTLRYTRWVGGEGTVPDWVMSAYSELLRNGLSSDHRRPLAPSPQGREVAAGDGETTRFNVKFTPSIGSGRPYTNISSAAVPLQCRTRILSDGAAEVELDLEPRLLSSVGTGSGALITSLGEIAALSAVGPDRQEVLSLKPISINCQLIRVAQDGTLVAHAVQENSGRHIRFVTVRITRKGDPDQLIANVTVVMRIN